MHRADQILSQTLERIAQRARWPVSTYRLQLHAGFTLDDAARIVPYLAELGITHCYASPYLKAGPGSTHGYDVIDHRQINPELGGREGLNRWIQVMRRHGLAHILDIVPNHAGIATNENAAWNDVLEHGRASRFAHWFDISWRGSPRPHMHDKVLLPLLGSPYNQALENGELVLALETREDGAAGLFVRYYQRKFPIDPGTYSLVMGHRIDALVQQLGADAAAVKELKDVIASAEALPDRSHTDAVSIQQRWHQSQTIQRRLGDLLRQAPQVAQFIAEHVSNFNGRKGDPRSFDRLDNLLLRQAYRLAYWRVAPDEINYRRFFDINDLAALAMEHADVFESTHELVLELLAAGNLAGVRVDHPDGLLDPRQYLRRLQVFVVLACARRMLEAKGEMPAPDQWESLREDLLARIETALPAKGGGAGQWPLYVVVEKILGAEESLPADWATQGTTGYDALNVINGVLVDGQASAAMSSIYREFTGQTDCFDDLAYAGKRWILKHSLASELNMLAHRMDQLAQRHRAWRDFTHDGIRAALSEVIACFPVYRSYLAQGGASAEDRGVVDCAIAEAVKRNPELERSVLDFVHDLLLWNAPQDFCEADRQEMLALAQRFQQVTAPATAKGVEDTAFYVYNRLISLNEVGGDPGRFGAASAQFHHYFEQRHRHHPLGLTPLSTHDTKRSEDVRARIDVLSEIPARWRAAVERWRGLNAPLCTEIAGQEAPDANEQYLLYQTLIGAWPIEGIADDAARASFLQRMITYMQKALREAKVHTTWTRPDGGYEQAVKNFVERALDPSISGAFINDVEALAGEVSHFGMLNSLSQTLLRLTVPGVADTYQGTELWDLSLVDPDNRRPVDYPRRHAMLARLKADAAAAGTQWGGLARELLERKSDGRIKLLLTWRALHCRKENPELFTGGSYAPLQVLGSRSEHVIAFARVQERSIAIVVAPRLMCKLTGGAMTLPLGEVWEDTRVMLPDGMSEVMTDALTGRSIKPDCKNGEVILQLANALMDLPLVLLVGANACGREAHS